MPSHPFAQVDVFGSGPLRGNPVAVVLDAEGLDDEAMRRFASWTNLSETTFLLPPSSDAADYRVRIFMATGQELPFAGHPTLGTCHAWLAAGGRPRGGAGSRGHGDGAADRIVQECGAGLVEIRRTPAGLAFAAPPLVRSGPLAAPLLAEVVAALGIDAGDVVEATWADNGPGWVAVLLESAQQVLELSPSFAELDIGVVGLHAPGFDEAAIEVRAFFPKDGAMVEDPVTGSLNASLAQWLLGSGRLHAPYVARQGTALGRDGRVHVTRDADGTIWIAGATVTCIEGTVALGRAE